MLLEEVGVVFQHDPKTAGRADRDARHAHSRRRYEEVWGREPPASVWDERGSSGGAPDRGASGDKRSAASSSAPAEPQAKRRGRGEKQFYRVYAKTLTGKVIALDICAYWTIRNVKEAIRDKEGMPPDFQRLIFCGRQLEDEQTCEDCEVRVGSTFHLVSKLRGC